MLKVNYLTHEKSGDLITESAWCAIPWNEEEESKTPLYFMIVSTFAAFIFPFTLVIVLYFKCVSLTAKMNETFRLLFPPSLCLQDWIGYEE